MRKTRGPKKVLRYCGVGLLCLFIVAWGLEVFAQEAYFNDIIVTNNTEDLLLYAVLEGAFSREADEALYNGLPLSITYNVRLLRERGFLMDEEINSLRINYQLTYDLTAGLCQFTWEEALKKGTRATRSLPTAKKWMLELSGIKIGDFRTLPAGGRYYVMLKADIRQGTVVFPLNYLDWFFRSGANLSTSWQRASFAK